MASEIGKAGGLEAPNNCKLYNSILNGNNIIGRMNLPPPPPPQYEFLDGTDKRLSLIIYSKLMIFLFVPLTKAFLSIISIERDANRRKGIIKIKL